MTNYDSKKLTELVLFILGKTGGVDFYHTFKILYFAEMKHLAKWGNGIGPDEFCALTMTKLGKKQTVAPMEPISFRQSLWQKS